MGRVKRLILDFDRDVFLTILTVILIVIKAKFITFILTGENKENGGKILIQTKKAIRVKIKAQI